MTAEGRERLRQAALATKPWLHSTGPRTAEGKARSADNGRHHQRGERSIRELQASVGDVSELMQQMQRLRKMTGS